MKKTKSSALKVFVSYPETEEDKRVFLDNLVTFKVELLLKCIENAGLQDEIKEKVLDKVFEILNESPRDSVI